MQHFHVSTHCWPYRSIITTVTSPTTDPTHTHTQFTSCDVSHLRIYESSRIRFRFHPHENACVHSRAWQQCWGIKEIVMKFSCVSAMSSHGRWKHMRSHNARTTPIVLHPFQLNESWRGDETRCGSWSLVSFAPFWALNQPTNERRRRSKKTLTHTLTRRKWSVKMV